MRWIGTALSLITIDVILASDKVQPPDLPCEDGDETCASAGGQAMLQKRSERAEEIVEVDDESAAGTQQYEYAGAQITISADSDVAKYGSGRWIITVASGCTEDDVAKFAEHMPEGSKAEFGSCPKNGDWCVFIMTGTESDVHKELATHTWPSKPSVDADHSISMIDEIDEHENGDSLLELEDDRARPGSWGLDRVDDPRGLDDDYRPTASYPNQGAGTHVYVLDTGVHTGHQDFGGRAFSAFTMYPKRKVCSPTDASCGADRQGHGTHCAGTIGGAKYGVAKKSKLYGVKVLSDSGSGTLGGIIQGIEYVIRSGNKPAIISMSLGGGGNDPGMKKAVEAAVRAGIPVSVAAGNSGRTAQPDACKYTPAHIPAAITVGATDRPRGSQDNRASYSSYGRCLDIYAPGSQIISASHRTNTGSATMSGTSMACPHVSGVIALMMGENKGMTPDAVLKKLLADSVSGTIQDAKPGSPNKMLQLGKAGPPGPPAPAPAPSTGPKTYVKKTSGLCTEAVKSKDDCKAAAAELGVKYKRFVSKNRAGWPPGCFSKKKRLFFNPKTATKRKCGHGGSVCLCES